MRHAFSFCKLDMVRSKIWLPSMAMLSVFSLMYALLFRMSLMGIWLIVFLSGPLYHAPFQGAGGERFNRTLPSSAREIVMGRYLYLLVIQVYLYLLYGVVVAGRRMMGMEPFLYQTLIMTFALTSSLMAASAANILLYRFPGCSRMWYWNIIRLVPGAVLSSVMVALMEQGQSVADTLRGLLSALPVMAVVYFLAGLLIWYVCARISASVYQKTDLV